MCKMPMVCGHSVSVDASRRMWRLCCMCTAELTAKLDSELVTGPRAADGGQEP